MGAVASKDGEGRPASSRSLLKVLERSLTSCVRLCRVAMVGLEHKVSVTALRDPDLADDDADSPDCWTSRECSGSEWPRQYVERRLLKM